MRNLFFRNFDGKCIFFFVFLGYFEKRCYFCNRLAEMTSKAMAKSFDNKAMAKSFDNKAMAKSSIVMRLIQVRVFQSPWENRYTHSFPISYGFGIGSLPGHSVSDCFEKKNNRHGMDGKMVYTIRALKKEWVKAPKGSYK